MRSSNMISQLYEDNLVESSCKVADKYGKEKLNEVIIKGVDVSEYHSLRQFRTLKLLADLTKGATDTQNNNQNNLN